MGIECPETYLDEGEDDHKGEKYKNKQSLEPGKGIVEPF